ncbi:hypothetical protein Ahy_A09g044524 isoform C [Arachis hypogaea]|uniref:Uncharacterized protein n=1 Tax=Arachis hypogaea TaxID=3818 RepID=A0A445BKA1_ARAHY|nr:hypothetical protein Ahy_A09g044524 isoform C [Arachis hypogaea]
MSITRQLIGLVSPPQFHLCLPFSLEVLLLVANLHLVMPVSPSLPPSHHPSSRSLDLVGAPSCHHLPPIPF